MAEDKPTTGEPRAPTQEELKREIASIDRSISELIFYGGNVKLLLNGDSVLKTRGGARGLAIYSDLARDPHVASVISKRKRAVTAREWTVTPSSDDAQDIAAADLVTAALKRLRFDRLTKNMLDATLKGYSAVEWIWSVIDGRELGMPGGKYLVPTKYKKRDQRRFIFDIDGNPRLITKENMSSGEALPDRKFTIHSSGEPDDDSPYGLGVGQAIFWPVFFKRQNITFWLTFNDKFGSPTAKASYPKGTNDAEQTKLLQTLQAISREAGIIVPDGMVVELLEAAKSSTDSYERMCHYMDAEISKAVLGETLTTTVGNTGGNRALGDVHNEVRIELAKDDADELSYTLNETIVRWIIDFNFPGRQPPSVWRNFDEQVDLTAEVDRDTKLKALGYERTEESFIDTYGDGYVKVQAPEQAKPDSPTAASNAQFTEQENGFFKRFFSWIGFAESNTVNAQRERNRQVQDAITGNATQLAGDWEKLLGPRVQELQTILDETGDLVQFRERLNEMINAAPNDALVESVARATFSSYLAGRLPRK
jgi:phage gp29-like protein